MPVDRQGESGGPLPGELAQQPLDGARAGLSAGARQEVDHYQGVADVPEWASRQAVPGITRTESTAGSAGRSEPAKRSEKSGSPQIWPSVSIASLRPVAGVGVPKTGVRRRRAKKVPKTRLGFLG
ncbi:hypothetical protein ABZU86_25900 [Streptomyces sp. NPDC005271]|uniref:hypothetical protein n=1 Tax=unclassified Streptomyces TaxID=2593676 RepID=UPI0033A53C1D